MTVRAVRQFPGAKQQHTQSCEQRSSKLPRKVFGSLSLFRSCSPSSTPASSWTHEWHTQSCEQKSSKLLRKVLSSWPLVRSWLGCSGVQLLDLQWHWCTSSQSSPWCHPHGFHDPSLHHDKKVKSLRRRVVRCYSNKRLLANQVEVIPWSIGATHATWPKEPVRKDQITTTCIPKPQSIKLAKINPNQDTLQKPPIMPSWP